MSFDCDCFSGSKMFEPKSKSEALKVVDHFKINLGTQPLWLGFMLRNEKQPVKKEYWLSLIDERKMPEDLWFSNEPNNKDKNNEGCPFLGSKKRVIDVSCNNYKEAKVICERNAEG